MPDLPPLDLDPTPEGALGRSDAELITAVRAGDTESYGVLYDRHVGAARSLSRQLTRDPNEGDDLVSEAFAKVLAILQGGGGPDVAFRAYLLTSVRRVAYDRTRAGARLQVTDDLEPYDSGEEFVDPAVAGLERTIVSRAYSSLPERWQTVLWHTEVEGLSPAEIAPLLGLTANGVAALAYRAREGLRQAYLQQHVMGQLADGCRPYADRLGAYARGGLSRRENAQVEAHLEHCEDCRALVLELTDVNHGMRAVVAPLVLGLVLAGYLKGLAVFGATGAVGAAAGSGAAAGTASSGAASGTASSGGGAAGATTGAGAATGAAGGGTAAAAAAVAAGTAGVTVGQPAAAAAASTVLAGAASGGGLLAGGWLAAAAAAVVGLATVGVTIALVTGGDEPGTTASGPAASAPQFPGLQPTSPGAPSAPGGGSEPTTSESPAPGGPSAAPSETASLVPSPTASPSPLPSATSTPSLSPSPSPSGSATPSPSPSESETPSPSPTPTAPAGPLTVVLEPLGDLVAGRTGVVAITVTNASSGGSTPITATVTLPPGVTYEAMQEGALDGGQSIAAAPPDRQRWSCTASVEGAVCDRPSLPPNRSSRLALVVRAAEGSAGDVPVSIAVAAKGAEPVVVTGERGVQANGLTARFAANGPYGVTEIGNALLSCPDAAPGCAAVRLRSATGGGLDDDAWDMTWYDADADPTTSASSAALLPDGGDVVWAGLYWSAAWDGTADPTAVRLRGPADGSYRTVTADQVDTEQARLFPVYQSFADVTAEVRAGGAGTWWVADPVARTGAGSYAGWALVVVRAVPGAPDAPLTVLDGLTAVRQGADPVAAVLPPLGTSSARVGTVAWEGDAGARGDSITLDDSVLTPLGGFRAADNVADSSASGALGPSLTFGTDVDQFLATVTPGRAPVVALRSTGETFFLGVVTLSGA